MSQLYTRIESLAEQRAKKAAADAQRMEKVRLAKEKKKAEQPAPAPAAEPAH